MKTRSGILMRLLAAAAVLAVPAAAAAVEGQARRDWTATVAVTPEGGVRMGNPAAAVKVVEFVSLTCGHCGDFAASGSPALVRDFVKSGRVSFELRPFPLDVVAATGAQLGRCASPAQEFALNHEILTTQATWFAKLERLTQQQVAEIDAAPPAEQRQRIAAAVGFDTIAARHGLTPQKQRQCLSDDGGAGRMMAIKQAGERLGISGTPSFAVNGKIAENVHSWAALEPLLRAQ